MSRPTPYQIVIVAPLFNLLLFTSAPGTTLPGSNFSDKTQRGWWVFTKVTHASATLKANRNSIFHLKGCFTNFLLFKCMLWAAFEVSPLKTVCVCPPPVISACERATTAAPVINMTRGVYYETMSLSAAHYSDRVSVTAGDQTQASVWEITRVKIVWFVLLCELVRETWINPQGAEPIWGKQYELLLDWRFVAALLCTTLVLMIIKATLSDIFCNKKLLTSNKNESFGRYWTRQAWSVKNVMCCVQCWCLLTGLLSVQN